MAFALPLTVVQSPDDRKAMHHFCHYAALDLSNYVSNRFWERVVLQGCQSDAAVRQAAIAVGDAHLELYATATVSRRSLAGFQKALSQLRTYMSQAKPSREVVLMCCILFFTFEKLRNDDFAADVHLRSGLSVLQTILDSSISGIHDTDPDSSNESDSRKDLAAILMQLDIESTIRQLGSRPPQLLLPKDMMVAEPCYPSALGNALSFTTAEEFTEPWLAYCHDLWRFVGDTAQYRHSPAHAVPLHMIEQKRSFAARLKTWRLAMDEYIFQHPIVNMTELTTLPHNEATNKRIFDSASALVIESHYFSMKRVLAECIRDETNPKPFDRNPEKLLRMGQTALALQHAHKQRSNLHVRKSLTTHIGMVDSLFVLAHRTSFPDIRSRAIELIRGFEEMLGVSDMSPLGAGSGVIPPDLVVFLELPGH